MTITKVSAPTLKKRALLATAKNKHNSTDWELWVGNVSELINPTLDPAFAFGGIGSDSSHYNKGTQCD